MAQLPPLQYGPAYAGKSQKGVGEEKERGEGICESCAKHLKPDIFDEARALVTGDRHEQYGDSSMEFTKVARAWSDIVGYAVEPWQVPMMMAALKIVRESFCHKRDNITDAIGYLYLANKFFEDDRHDPE